MPPVRPDRPYCRALRIGHQNRAGGGKADADRIAEFQRRVDIVANREKLAEIARERVFHARADIGDLLNHRRQTFAIGNPDARGAQSQHRLSGRQPPRRQAVAHAAHRDLGHVAPPRP